MKGLTKMNKKILMLISIVLVMVSLLSIAVYATDSSTQPTAEEEMMLPPIKSGTVKSRHKSGSANFTSSWEIHTMYLDGTTTIGVMWWGYNTFLVKEDYSYTFGANNNSSQSYVFRNGYDTSYNYGTYRPATEWSRKEVTHKVNDVYYGIYLSGTYPNATYSDY